MRTSDNREEGSDQVLNSVQTHVREGKGGDANVRILQKPGCEGRATGFVVRISGTYRVFLLSGKSCLVAQDLLFFH